MPHPDAGRCLTVPQVAEELSTSAIQVTVLIKRGDLNALQLGGRGQWRIERDKPEEYIARAYDETAAYLAQRGEGGEWV